MKRASKLRVQKQAFSVSRLSHLRNSFSRLRRSFFRLASPFRGSVCIFRICPLVFFEAPSLAYLNRTQNQRLRLLGSGSVNKW